MKNKKSLTAVAVEAAADAITVKITDYLYLGLDERAAALFLATTNGYADGVKGVSVFKAFNGATTGEIDNAYLTGYHLGYISRTAAL